MIEHSNPHKRGGYKHPHQKDGEVPYEASVPMIDVSPGTCPKCGAPEVERNSPRTYYACGSNDYDQRPGTFIPGDSCKSNISPEAREAALIDTLIGVACHILAHDSDTLKGTQPEEVWARNSLRSKFAEILKGRRKTRAIATQTEELARLRETRNQLNAEIDRMIQERAESHAESVKALEERNSLRSENERLREACAKEFDSVQTLDNENQRLRAENERLRNSIKRMREGGCRICDNGTVYNMPDDRDDICPHCNGTQKDPAVFKYDALSARIATLEQQAREKEESASTQLKCKLAEYRRRTALREAMGRVLTILEEVESVPSGERTAKGKSAISAARVEIDRAFKADSVPFAATAATNKGGSEG